MVRYGFGSLGRECEDFFVDDDFLLWCLMLKIDVEKWLRELEICNDVIFPDAILFRLACLEFYRDFREPQTLSASLSDAALDAAQTLRLACAFETTWNEDPKADED